MSLSRIERSGPRPRAAAVVALAALALLPLSAPPAGASEPSLPDIAHDPEAAAEVAAALAALRALPSYRQRWTDLEPVPGGPRVTEFQSGGRMRIVEEDDMAGWKGTTESIFVSGKAAVRFVSPELDAHLAKLKARERAATLVSVGMELRNLFQALAMGGPMGVLAVAESGLGLLGTARGGLSSLADEDLYRNWHCTDLPDLPPGVMGGAAGADGAAGGVETLGGAGGEERVARLPATTVDGEPVRAYRQASLAGGALLDYRIYVGDASGLPKRTEMSIEMPGFTSRSTMDFYDYSAPIEIELPDCAKRAG